MPGRSHWTVRFDAFAMPGGGGPRFELDHRPELLPGNAAEDCEGRADIGGCRSHPSAYGRLARLAVDAEQFEVALDEALPPPSASRSHCRSSRPWNWRPPRAKAACTWMRRSTRDRILRGIGLRRRLAATAQRCLTSMLIVREDDLCGFRQAFGLVQDGEAIRMQILPIGGLAC